jgi:hypothetical protein
MTSAEPLLVLTEAFPLAVSNPFVGAANVVYAFALTVSEKMPLDPKTLIADFSEIGSRPATLEVACLLLMASRFC